MYQAVRADYSNATDLADYLTAKGMPFRHSHETVGRIVLHCINHHNYLQDLTLDEFQTFSDLIEEDIFDALDPETIVNARRSTGGTARQSVEEQLTKAEAMLKDNRAWLQTDYSHS